MVIDMKIRINGVKIKDDYLLKAALFRRCAMNYLDVPKNNPMFSAEILVELYKFESTGKATRTFEAMKKDNGYTLGKWLRDLDVSMIREGIQEGLFFKWEYMDTPLKRVHNKKFISEIDFNFSLVLEKFKDDSKYTEVMDIFKGYRAK